jgi:uncharacterized protein YndB with AHSA1/START domain
MEKTKTKSIRQTTQFKAAPHEVYEALMDDENRPETPKPKL